jgi:membrane associated rhomboid family serine protease
MSSIWDYIKKANVLIQFIVINVAVFVVINIILVAMGLAIGDPGQFHDLYLSCTADIRAVPGRFWTIITYMFTHHDFGHIFGNMLILFFVGRIFLQLLGTKKFIATYILGGVSGWLFFALSYNIFPAFEPVGSRMVGASASVMAIFLAAATYSPNYRFNLPLVGAVPLWLIAGIYVLYDFVSLRYYVNSGGHLAHLGGAFYGFIMASQLRGGRDISRWFEGFMDNMLNFFKKGRSPKLKVVKATRKGKSDEEFNAEKKKSQERVDLILDKISKSGYDSLTKDEKDFLFRQSQR